MNRKRKHNCPNTDRGLGKRPRVQEDATDWFDEYCADFDYRTWQYVDELKNPRREKSPSKPEQSQIVTRGRPTTSIEVSRQEESPSKPKSPVRRSSRIFMNGLKRKNALTVPEELCVKRKKPEVCVGHFGSEPENSSVKKRKTEIPIDEQSGLEQSPMDEKTAIDAEASTQERSPPKPEKSPITRGKSGKAVAASRQEKSPSKPQRSPIVTRGRSTKSVEAFKKKLSTVVPDQKGKNVLKKKWVTPKISNLPITRGKSIKAVAASRQEKCPSKPEQSQIVTRGNSTKSVEAFKKKLSTVVPDQKGKNVLKKKLVTPKISNLPITRGKSRKAVAASRHQSSIQSPMDAKTAIDQKLRRKKSLHQSLKNRPSQEENPKGCSSFKTRKVSFKASTVTNCHKRKIHKVCRSFQKEALNRCA
ncbi:hypothetical protein TNCT_432061 [Trichonephila clavata]|uniref:Uncharacterized protein n=1 Tax=Trichonephila clavata TaxID=2740835 RepID=A0A8X6I1Y1_TRICU|nr:hypothetical protein TNCT_432061 [Trichonephila clavata]